jgi:hypothetical protein
MLANVSKYKECIMQLIPPTQRVPLWLKLSFTTFMAILIPVYWWCYGPTNFLYFCDVALMLVLLGIWRESSLLISMAGVGIIAPQLLWVVDFCVELGGGTFTGMTAYMFNSERSLFLRGLSLFHGWLPFLLLYLIWRIGYDRRAMMRYTGLAWGLIILCFVAFPGPRPDAASIATPVNINYVHGMSDTHAQTMMLPTAWLGTLMGGLLIVFYLPTHLVLSWLFAPKKHSVTPIETPTPTLVLNN